MAAKVTILAGPVRSGKTTRLLDRYRDCLKNRRGRFGLAGPAIWIGPNYHAIAQVRDCLLSSSEDAFLDPQILTFAGFAESTLANRAKQIHPITRLQKGRILQQVVENCLDMGKLKHFARVAKTPGFLAQVDESLAELKRRDIWPEDFAQLARHQRDHDLATLYSRYQQYLNDHDLYDAEGRFWAARKVLAQATVSDAAQFDLIVVDGFSDFTPAQVDILRLLSDQSHAMAIALTLDSKCLEAADEEHGRALLFAKTKNTLDRLRQVFPEVELERGGTTHFANPLLKHLEQNLFQDLHESGPEATELTGVEILAANGVQGEVQEIARRIKSLLLSSHVRPQEIVVVFRSLEGVAERIGEVFADHGIPYALGPWQSVASSPIFRGILSLLRLHAEDWPFRQLLGVVGNRLFRRFDIVGGSPARHSNDARIALERCLRAAQLPSGKRALIEQLQHWASASCEDTSERTSGNEKLAKLASQARLALSKLEELAELLEELPKQAPLAEWIGHVERLLTGLNTLSQENDHPTALAWKMLRGGAKAIELVDRWSSSEPPLLSLREFVELLEMVGRDLRLPAPHDAVGRVRILHAEAARYASAKHVFLAGLQEKTFATSEPENSLFSERGLDPTFHPSQIGDEMLLFYELVTRATERLTLSYPALDAKGQTLSPSPLLTELERCFGKAPVPRTEMSLGEEIDLPHSPNSFSAYRRWAVAQALEGNQHWLAGLAAPSESARLGQSLFGSLLDGIGCIAQRGARGEFGPYDGLLQSSAAQAVLAKRFDASHLWSPSQLERYATCPFRFFAEQILLLEPPSELTLRSDARRRGSLLHQVLATLHEHLESVEDCDDPARLIRRFQEVLNKAVEAAPLEGLQRWLREIERREIEAWAANYAEQEIEYRNQWAHLDQPLRPAFFEVRFGPQVATSGTAAEENASTTLPFELDLGAEQILLTGQIDRVDVGCVGGVTVFNIIDYKSGAEVNLQVDKICSGLQLQLPLYAMAAEKHLLAEQGALAMATGYWNIQGQGFTSRRSGALEIRELKDQAIRTSEQWDQLQPVLLQRIRQLIHGIRTGQFPVYNANQDCTRFCDFSTICRVAHTRSLEKVWEPPAPPTTA